MKYAVFGLAFVIGVPLMAVGALYYRQVRSWLLSFLMAVPMLGQGVKLNFVSLESYRGPDRGFEVTLADLVALALAITLLVKDRGRLRWLPTNSLWMLVFFLFAVGSAFAAPVGVYAGFTLWKMARMYLIFWVVANLVRSGVELRAVWRGMFTIGLVMLGFVLKQKYLNGYYRITGPFEHSNTVPLYLNVLIPPLLVWLLADPALSALKRALSLLAVFGMLFAVQATFSRGGMLLAGVGFLGALALANVRLRSSRALLVTILVLGGLVLGGLKAAPSIIERIRSAPPASEAARDEFNHAASLMIADRPLGIGINSFSHVLTVTKRYNEHIAVMKSEPQAGVCHHIYWLTLAELGWPGFFAFLIVIGRFFTLAAFGSLRGRSLETLLLGGFAIGFLAMHLQGFLEWAFRITPVTQQFSIVAGVVVGLLDLVRAGEETPLTPPVPTALEQEA